MACIPYGGFDPVTTYGYTCQEWREDESPLESCNDDINSQGRPVGQ
ncbi:MAG: hypothetical protein LBG59_07620 [Candidatus Peribacteria bacterium]|nr:hypothetical protein [Candidatus Peribacteria bacterium]